MDSRDACFCIFLPSVVIQIHFMGAEIPGFDFPNRFSGGTLSHYSNDGTGKLIFNKVK
jgi:hypothetical protein